MDFTWVRTSGLTLDCSLVLIFCSVCSQSLDDKKSMMTRGCDQCTFCANAPCSFSVNRH